MRIDIVTIFPEIFGPVLNHSIVKRAQEQGQVEIHVHNLRDYTHDKRRTVDDRPYGGGPGMVMRPEPLFEAVEAIEVAVHGHRSAPDCQVILMSPGGAPLTQAVAGEMAGSSHLVILCGHYEGVDDRVRQGLVTREISIGDYVLTGGELPAMVLVDSVTRLIPGVLGHEESAVDESFSDGLLEYPQYTRPPVFRGLDVPDILRSGNHEQIGTWRRLKALAKTLAQRPDLLSDTTSSDAKRTRDQR